MKYYCEYNNKFYDTAEECAKSEEEYKLKIEQEEKAKIAAEKEKEAFLEEISTAREVYVEAKEVYCNLLKKYKDRYGYKAINIAESYPLSNLIGQMFDF